MLGSSHSLAGHSSVCYSLWLWRHALLRGGSPSQRASARRKGAVQCRALRQPCLHRSSRRGGWRSLSVLFFGNFSGYWRYWQHDCKSEVLSLLSRCGLSNLTCLPLSTPFFSALYVNQPERQRNNNVALTEGGSREGGGVGCGGRLLVKKGTLFWRIRFLLPFFASLTPSLFFSLSIPLSLFLTLSPICARDLISHTLALTTVCPRLVSVQCLSVSELHGLEAAIFSARWEMGRVPLSSEPWKFGSHCHCAVEHPTDAAWIRQPKHASRWN